MIKKIVWFFIGLLLPNFVTIKICCWFSRHFYDIHDYTHNRGGDNVPYHFYTYTCHNCNKDFTI